MRRQLERLAMIGFLGLALVGVAQAQQNQLVGTWSTTFFLSDGRGWASVFVSFDANGRCQERITVHAGIVTHACQYRLSPDATSLQVLFYDYTPKSIAPARPLNQWMTVQLQWENRDLFHVIEATGPVRYVRQR